MWHSKLHESCKHLLEYIRVGMVVYTMVIPMERQTQISTLTSITVLVMNVSDSENASNHIDESASDVVFVELKKKAKLLPIQGSGQTMKALIKVKLILLYWFK